MATERRQAAELTWIKGGRRKQGKAYIDYVRTSRAETEAYLADFDARHAVEA
jgi:hypothetical protein